LTYQNIEEINNEKNKSGCYLDAIASSSLALECGAIHQFENPEAMRASAFLHRLLLVLASSSRCWHSPMPLLLLVVSIALLMPWVDEIFEGLEVEEVELESSFVFPKIVWSPRFVSASYWL